MTRICLGMMVGFLVGCANTEPYHRTDVWYPTGANAGNIAAMAVRPSDLILGRSDNEGDARQAAGAINRVWEGQTKPLSSTSSPSVSAGGASGSGGQN